MICYSIRGRSAASGRGAVLVPLGQAEQATQFRGRRIRPEARAAPLKTGGGGQIAHHHRLAAGITHQPRGNLNGVGIVSGDGNAQLAALPLGRGVDGRGPRVPDVSFARLLQKGRSV